MSYSGYLIIFDEANRSDIIEEYISIGLPFSDALSVPDWQFHQREFCFLSFDNNHIQYAALVTRGRRVATKKVRVSFSEYVEIDPIEFAEIEQSLGKQIRPYFTKITGKNGGRFPPATWNAVFEFIIKLRPSIATKLRNLVKMCTSDGDFYQGNGYEIVAQEKDAITLAFKIFKPDILSSSS